MAGVTVPAAFQQLMAATDDEMMTSALHKALPTYFADFPRRRSEFADQVGDLRASLVTQDPESFDLRPRLGGITAPTLIIVGTHDFICGPRWADILHAAIPGSRLVELKHSGQFGHVEQPAEFAAATAVVSDQTVNTHPGN